MVEGEPHLQDRPHPNIQEFFKVLDQTVSTTEKGETGLSLIPQDKRDEVNAMAQTVDELFAQGEPAPEALIATLKERHEHELKGHPTSKIGFFKTLHAVSGDRLGRTGEKPGRPGFKLVFAIIPKGYTAPSHIHRDLEVPTGFGEITASLQKVLYAMWWGRMVLSKLIRKMMNLAFLQVVRLIFILKIRIFGLVSMCSLKTAIYPLEKLQTC